MISIVIPVYNTSKYLSQCFDSILCQSYSDWEMIVVNDASKDNSLSICKRYAAMDNRIHIIDKKQNEGSELARYSGSSVATGKYIMFLDADDWLCDREILKKMVDIAEETGAGYVEMGMQRVMDKHGWIKRPSRSQVSGLVTQPELFEKYYLSFFGYNILSVTMWGKLYRKSVVDDANLSPSGLVMGEDLAFNIQLFPYLKSIYILEDIGYSYRFGGMTTRYNPHLYPDLKSLYHKKKELIAQYSYYKANDYIRYEMVNVLKSDIRQKILYKYGNKEEIVSQIQSEFRDPMWQDIAEVSNKTYLDKPIPKAILSRNAETVYELCNKEVKSSYNKWYMKKIASKMLQWL